MDWRKFVSWGVRICAQQSAVRRSRFASHAGRKARTGVVVAAVLACGMSIGVAAAAADETEQRNREITISVPLPDEIEAVKDLIEAGDLDHAQHRANVIESPRNRIISLGYVAEAFAKRGEIGITEAIAQSLAITAQRDWVLVYAVTGAVSHSSDAETADRLVSAISGPTERTRALCLVALGQLVRGQAADAEQTAVRAATEARQIIAPNSAAEMRGWITALSDELGEPPNLKKALDDQSWFLGLSPAYWYAAMSSAEMHYMIRQARDSLEQSDLN